MEDLYQTRELEGTTREPEEQEERDKPEPRPAGLLQRVAYGGVVLFCTMYFFRPEDFLTALAPIPIAKVIGGITGLALLGTLVAEGSKLPKQGKILLALLAYLVVCIPFSRWPGGSLDIVVFIFAKGVVIALATMVSVASTKQLRRLLTIQALAMALMSAIAIGQPRMQGRMYGTGNLFADPNDFALNLCIVMAFAVAFVTSSKKVLGRIFWIAAICLMIGAIILTGSRGGFLAMTATFFGLWRRLDLSRTMRIAVVVFAALLLVSAVVVIGGTSYLNRISTITDINADVTGSAEARRDLLMMSLETTVKHPLFGIGPGQFENFSGAWHLTHNTYTEFSSEAGLPSLVLFLYLLFLTFKDLRERPKDPKTRALSDGLYGAMFGYLVGAFFLSTAYLFVPYLLMAYVSAIAKIRDTMPEEGSTEGAELEEYQYDVPGWEEPQHEH